MNISVLHPVSEEQLYSIVAALMVKGDYPTRKLIRDNLKFQLSEFGRHASMFEEDWPQALEANRKNNSPHWYSWKFVREIAEDFITASTPKNKKNF